MYLLVNLIIIFWLNIYEEVFHYQFERAKELIDPVTAIAGATAAFNAIKSGFSVGKDIENMAGDLGRWMNCISDLKKAEELNKKPPLFKKLFQAGSVEEEAMQVFMAKKKAEDMREQLKQIIIMSRGLSAWDELLRTEGDIRKKRQQMIYAQEERRRQLLEVVGIIVLVAIIGGACVGLAYLYVNR